MLILDEVDAGIGGDTANRVAAKLGAMSLKSQIFVVSHLHQIARVADHHFAVQKTASDSGRPIIDVHQLRGKDIARELERMLALPD